MKSLRIPVEHDIADMQDHPELLEKAGVPQAVTYASPIAGRIREVIDLRGTTANALEAKIGRPDAVRNILRAGAFQANHFPRVDTLIAIADGLRTSLEYLAIGRGDRDLVETSGEECDERLFGEASDLVERCRRYLTHVLDKTGFTASGLANHIGVSSSTLTRLLNDPDHPFSMSTVTIAKIERATGVRFSDCSNAVPTDDSASYIWALAGDTSCVMTRAEAERQALGTGQACIVARIVSEVKMTPSLEAVP